MAPWPAALLVALLAVAPASAQTRTLEVAGDGRPLDLVDLVRAENPEAPFTVAVAFADGETVARQGDAVRFRVRSTRGGYLTLVNRNPEGAVTLLYPNRFAPSQRIAADQDVFFPAGSEFVIRVSGPFGQEVVKAIVTPEPLIDQAAAERLFATTPVLQAQGPPASDAGRALGGRFAADDWATGSLYLTTAPAGGPAAAPAAPAAEVPPAPDDQYSERPGRAWRSAYRDARRATRSLARPVADESRMAGEPPPAEGLIPVDGSVLVLYRPAVGTRSFGRSLEGGGVFGQLRRIDPGAGATDAAGTRSLGDLYGETADEVVDAFRDDPDVIAAVPNYALRPFAPRVRPGSRIPAEALPERAEAGAPPALWPLQWPLHNAFWRSPAERVDLGWREALANYRPPADPVIVAVLDTGVYAENPHLAPLMWRNTRETPRNGIDDDGNGFVDDTWGWDAADDDNDPSDTKPESSHGTFVAAQIAGGTPDALLYGMAPDVRIMAVRVLGGARGSGYETLVRGIRYAVQNGARVINASLGAGPSDRPYPALERMLGAVFDEAAEHGALVVFSAGNEGSDSRVTFTYPARVSRPNTISVAAVGLDGRLLEFSNHGPNVDVAAPGDAILGHYGPTAGVEDWRGTSMAAPYVAALAAMLFAQHPDWTPAQVKDRILSTARPLGLDVATGAVVDAAAALAD